MRILFIGGTGIISSACVPLVLAAGHTLTVLNRGTTTTRPLPPGVEVLRADAHDPAAVRVALGSREFDVVVQFVGFTPADVSSDVEVFAGRTGHYVFVSSASVYHKPPRHLPITESTPRHNPFWRYSQDKIACEELLGRAGRDVGFPVTIVRPSQTYDRAIVPIQGGWTQVERLRAGRPVVVHGDGTALWTLTHHTEVAARLVGLLGRTRTVGEAYTITGDDVLTWDQIMTILGEAAGAPPRIVHVPTDLIATLDPGWGAILRADQAHSSIFDNSKVRALVPGPVPAIPFEHGAREIVAWHDADPARRVVDPILDKTIDAIIDRLS